MAAGDVAAAGVDATLDAARAHHRAGRLAEAEALYRQVLRVRSEDAGVHHDLGAVLEAAGDLEGAASSYRHTLERVPAHADAHYNLGGVYRKQGRVDEAIASFRASIAASPQPDAYNNLGALYHAQGRFDDAIAAFREAVARDAAAPVHRRNLAAALFDRGNALYAQGRLEDAVVSYGDAVMVWPDHAAAHNNLGNVLDELGHAELALASYRRALALADDPTLGANFARCVRKVATAREDPELRTLVGRALVAPWARPGDLARAAGALLSRLPEQDRARDPLFAALLTSAPVGDLALERHVAALRRALLAGRTDDLPLACAVARQCFVNEYVLAEDDAETAEAERLAADIGQALGSGAEVSPMRVAALASYRPLHALRDADRLLERAWPEPLRAVLTQQIVEPREADALRQAIPGLTPIDDETSRRVQAQYERNPYPRWIGLPRAVPLPFHAWLARQLPGTHVDAQAARPLEILIAGCGTGQEAVETAERHPDARVTAVDLSRASLAYAAWKSRERGLANVQYAQADLLRLPALGRRFDVVSAVGVLHHLADPMAGWRALVECLAPDGFMQVGLYSAVARRDVDAARAFVAARGDPPTPAGIRAAREALRADPRFAGVTALRDFHATSDCRDLLFHVREQGFTLARIGDALRELGLALLGFVLDPAVLRRYRDAHPQDPSATGLARWDAFERAHPDTFLGMYQFWVRREAVIAAFAGRRIPVYIAGPIAVFR